MWNIVCTSPPLLRSFSFWVYLKQNFIQLHTHNTWSSTNQRAKRRGGYNIFGCEQKHTAKSWRGKKKRQCKEKQNHQTASLNKDVFTLCLSLDSNVDAWRAGRRAPRNPTARRPTRWHSNKPVAISVVYTT